VLYSLMLSPYVAALSISGGTVGVAVNALLLKGLHLSKAKRLATPLAACLRDEHLSGTHQERVVTVCS
jgi:hypothetical protein